MAKTSSIKTVNTVKSIKNKAKGFFRRFSSKNSGADDTKTVRCKTRRHSDDRQGYPTTTGAHPASRSSMTLAENFNYEDHKPSPYEDEPQTVLADVPADAMSVHRDVEPVWSFTAPDGRMVQLEEINQLLLEEYFHDRELNGITVRDANFPEKYVTIHLRDACTCNPRAAQNVRKHSSSSSSSASTAPATPRPPQILHLGRDCHRQFLPVWRFDHRGQWRRFDENNQIHLETVFGYRNHQKIRDQNFPGQGMLVRIHSDDLKISFKGVMTFLPPEEFVEEPIQEPTPEPTPEPTQKPTQELNGHDHKRRTSAKRALKRSPSIATL